jgi:hypothetical protein
MIPLCIAASVTESLKQPFNENDIKFPSDKKSVGGFDVLLIKNAWKTVCGFQRICRW